MKYRVVWEHAPFARCKGEWKVFREYTEYDEHKAILCNMCYQ